MALQLSRRGKGKGPDREKDPTKSLTNALKRFQDVLSPEQKKEFKSVSAVPDAAEVLFFVAKLDAENGSKTRRSISPRLCTFLSATQQFAGAVETFVSSNPTIAALVWGGIKTAIVVASNVASYFDKVTNMIMQIGRFCPTFQQFGKLYHGCTGLQQALCDYYSVIVDLCVKIVEVSRRTFAMQTISSMWSPFESDFKPFLDQLDIATQDITLQASLASKQADDEAKRLLEYESKENSSFRHSALAIFRKSATQSDEAREWQLNQTKREMGSLKIEIRRNLSLVDHIDPWKRVLKKRVRSTAKWLTKEPAFLSWRNSTETAVLWCSGTMGMGKTVLMSNVIAQLHSSCQNNETVAHFFCLAENEISLSARNIIGSISRQLLDSFIEQSDYENLLSMRNESQHLDTSETVQFLLSRLSPEKTYYIALDGLDECTSSQIRTMARAIASISEQMFVKLKIICAGRPDLEEDLFRWCRPQHRIVIDEQKLHFDLDRYIIASLDDCLESQSLVLRDPTNITKIVDVLREGSQGMFLWINLCIGELCEQNCDEDILHALNHLPRSLAELFDSKIRRIQQGPEKIQALKLIQFCGVMKRPLTEEEYREALSISKGDKALNVGKIPNNINRIVRGCYGLTFIDEEDETIHYIHQSVKDHFFHTTQEGIVKFDARRIDENIGLLCMTYLNFTNFSRQLVKAKKDYVIPVHAQSSLLAETSPLANKIAQKLLTGKEKSTSMKFRDFERTLESLNVYQSQTRNTSNAAHTFQFLAYAKENWIFHLKDFCIDQEPEMWSLFRKCIEDRTLPLSRAWELPAPSQEALISDKIYLTYFHDRNWAPFLLEMARCHGYSEYEWAWALRETHFVLFRYLTENPKHSRPPPILKKGIRSFLPFNDGSSYRWVEILIGLPSFARCWGQALSSVALDNGLSEQERPKVSLMLLEKMCAISKNNSRFALGLALRHMLSTGDGFKLMLSINKAFYSGIGVINDDLTTYKMHSELPELSIDREAPLLIIAAQYGHNAGLREILQMGADVDVRDHLERTALLEAAMCGHWDTLDILVAANAELNLTNAKGETALHIASKQGRLNVISSLVSAGASIDIRDSHLETALHVAVSMGHQEVIKYLVMAGADINLRNKHGETPLHLSTSEWRLNEMAILLAASPYLELKNSKGETALQKAAKRKDTDAIALLIAAGATDDLGDDVHEREFYKSAIGPGAPKAGMTGMLLSARLDASMRSESMRREERPRKHLNAQIPQ
ncbi:hypothetical protein N7540_006600 [Penicillium herquei]|nr:hypothetical protein N7540_006600 [Penicillium herquei]